MPFVETKFHTPTVSIPITLPQIAEGLRRLSKGELETLELLLDKKALTTIRRSLEQTRRRRFRELKP